MIKEHDKPPSSSLSRNKDENSKPVRTSKYSNEHTSIRSGTGPTLLATNQYRASLQEANPVKVFSNDSQPILANLSTNLKTVAKQEHHRSLVKESSVLASKAQVPHDAAPHLDTLAGRLTTASKFMSAPVQLLDDSLTWKEGLQEFLIDQSDFLVVGVLGKRCFYCVLLCDFVGIN